MLTELETNRLNKLTELLEGPELVNCIQSIENLQSDIDVYNKLSNCREMYNELHKKNEDLSIEHEQLKNSYILLFSHKESLTKQVDSLKTNGKVDEKYQSLREVLDMAYEQAASGKGHERHGGGLPFEQQPMQTICRDLGSSEGMAFQVTKKLLESYRLPTLDAKIRELLGAINYVAGMIIFEKAKSGKV